MKNNFNFKLKNFKELLNIVVRIRYVDEFSEMFSIHIIALRP